MPNDLLTYRSDKRYSIDNIVAERAIRPLVINRNNFLFFVSEDGVYVTTTF